MKFILIILVFIISSSGNYSQGFFEDKEITKADSLRGMLTPLRTCYDVIYYHLTVKPDYSDSTVSGNNLIAFKVIESFSKIQIDLSDKLDIEKIIYRENELKFSREFNAVFVDFPSQLLPGTIDSIKVFYSGKPKVSEHPPWDGGMIWNNDKDGNPWISVAVQGAGASLWYPNKDHQSDEPDSALISIISPAELSVVSNGKLRSIVDINNELKIHNWFVSYPINSYNITFYIGRYKSFSENYNGINPVEISFYVLPENLEKAMKHFRNISTMLECFEKYFGAYPWPDDGFKIVEAPMLGMEHQSAIAYGNKYLQGYSGYSWSKEGLLFDHVLVHEAAHEWWGNSITTADIADMWIHEGFATYAEALYLECTKGYNESLNYLNGLKSLVDNEEPVLGEYNINKEGSSDMYQKGALMLNTLRHVVDDDNLWFKTLRQLAEEFKYKITSTEEVVDFLNKKLGINYSYFFDQYLKYKDIPELEVALIIFKGKIYCRYKWNSDVYDFHMPVKVTISEDNYDFIFPTVSWQETELKDIDPEDFKVAEDKFYLKVKITRFYFDENLNIENY